MSADIGNIVQAGTSAITGIAIAGAVVKTTQKAFSGSNKKRKAPRF